MRYFLVVFGGLCEGQSRISNMTVSDDRGHYVSLKETENHLAKLGWSNVVITNIIELSESDFADYTQM